MLANTGHVCVEVAVKIRVRDTDLFESLTVNVQCSSSSCKNTGAVPLCNSKFGARECCGLYVTVRI